MRMHNGSMTTQYSHGLLRLLIAIFCIFLIAASLLGDLPAFQEGAPSLQTVEPLTPDLSRGTPGPTARPEALVGLSALGAPTATPGPSPFPEWVETRRSTAVWTLPFPPSRVAGQLPERYPLKVVGAADRRLQVRYEGLGEEEAEGEGWVDLADVEPVPAPKWVSTRRGADLRSGLGRGDGAVSRMPDGAVVEVLEDRGRDLLVFDLGDGRAPEPLEGWVKASEVGAAATMLSAEKRGMRRLTRSDVASLRAGDGLWMKVPFRTQLDGSPAEAANCGPASVGMVLEYFHSFVPTDELRTEANRLQGTRGSDNGFGIEYLLGLAEKSGLRGHGLYAGAGLRRWSLEDLRSQLIQGRLVIPELRFRYMPGRARSGSWDDHYVVITGMRGDDFIYNDSVDADGPGYGRVMSSEVLTRAWGGSDLPFAAFAISRP
ncbi:MAG: C39 family peptidase [Chloroflexota bacterium]